MSILRFCCTHSGSINTDQELTGIKENIPVPVASILNDEWNKKSFNTFPSYVKAHLPVVAYYLHTGVFVFTVSQNIREPRLLVVIAFA